MSEIELRCGTSTAVASTVGGELLSFRCNGTDYIYNRDPAVWPNHSPVVFPTCGETIDDTVRFEGKAYPMKKHGFTRGVPFEAVRHGEAFAELVYRSNPETLRQYPYHFALHIVHTIRDDGFSTDFIVDNESGRTMPMCIGGHPGFNCPLHEGERFDDYVLQFDQPEDGHNYLISNGVGIDGEESLPSLRGGILPLEHRLFDEHDALFLSTLKSRTVRLLNRSTGKGFAFTFGKFDVLAVWTKPFANGDYICLEPWCGLPAFVNETGNFEDKPFVKTVPPGESFHVGYSLKTIE